MADIKVSIDNRIIHPIGEVYLPVRCMSCDNLGIYGTVAVVACNRGHSHLYGYVFTPYEDEKTEYFIFPKSFSLYQELYDDMFQDNTWFVRQQDWIATKGAIFGEEKIVYFHKILDI